jgi:hypothetical protein
MSTGIIAVVVVAVVVVGVVVFGVLAVLRRRRLQQRFGPEYDRLVGERAWHGENAGTEELRAAVQRYRAFGGRLADFTREI